MTYATSAYGFYLEPNNFQEFLSKINENFGTDFKDIYDAIAFLDEEYISSIILCDNVLFQSPKLEIKTLEKALVFHASGPTPPFDKQPYESENDYLRYVEAIYRDILPDNYDIKAQSGNMSWAIDF
jgi:hypothetical protein